MARAVAAAARAAATEPGADPLGGPELATEAEDVRVTDVHHDSRRVGPGSLFCAVPGATDDGHRHAPEAVAAGAVALLVERPLGLGVPEIVVADARTAMAPAAATVFGHPSRDLVVVGVTGTNGKTTVTHLVRAALEAGGRRAEVIGTLSGARTTPEAPDLQRRLAELVDAGVDAVALEVSSHALALARVDAVVFDVAVFTNLGRDHLDFHGTMEAYFQAKARLFEAGRAARAVVNLDDPYGRLLRDAAAIPTEGYSLDEAVDLEVRADGCDLTWEGERVTLPMGGRFNAANALAAAHVARALGVDPPAIARGLSTVATVPGRFEAVDAGQPFRVVVDYAHTPDGLAEALATARDVAGVGRVIVVFGCGGDRDRAKRPAMGEVAARLADRVVLTSDNPRSEDPLAIIEEARQGMLDTSGLVVEPDRRRAIAIAVDLAAPDDIVLVAGKGHETTQVIGDRVLDLDDRLVARDAIIRRSGTS
ncbi:MAG TPA: UDP-N-acetylmuramoyl-L-alanyl-D-glutamate--2,6-diaminopimelate ligase [Acidimicrobiales bacterium]|nr:UDP-N-acetylmuramoyl-L-alanyl-D-glutamate--2,6-diaminopimelate ligase [Acidimicrobiales bacterium]